MKMHRVGLSVTNSEKAISFYCDDFDMEVLAPVFPFGALDYSSVMGLENASGRMCMIANDIVRLELFEFASPKHRPKDLN